MGADAAISDIAPLPSITSAASQKPKAETPYLHADNVNIDERLAVQTRKLVEESGWSSMLMNRVINALNKDGVGLIAFVKNVVSDTAIMVPHRPAYSANL